MSRVINTIHPDLKLFEDLAIKDKADLKQPFGNVLT